jgi:hypothetical protein
MAMTLHALTQHLAVEDIQRSEQRRGAVACRRGSWSGAILLHRQARLGSVERLDLALLITMA